MKHPLLFIALLFLAFQGFSQDSLQTPATLVVDCTLPCDSTVEPEVHLDLITVEVVKVYDGDGCRALFPDGTVRKLRFANLDAPDIKNAYVDIDSTQPFAIASRDSLRRMILHKQIQIDTLPFGDAKYSYGRLLVDAYTLPLEEGEPTVYLNQLIVSKGWAWAVSSRKNQVRANGFLYGLIEEGFARAKAEKQGLWKGKGRKYSPGYWRTNPWRKSKTA